ncbi:hypothetical protein [Halosimplex salinum]|uniref:hypothetical protein n=1 Tax=Halosimplex salinum TaxID=1710538 RepID=UPI000F48A6E5|nr:hypothetical protein [Halosimplex salinum]
MSWARRLWIVLAMLAVLGAGGVLVAATYGQGGVVVEDVTVTGATPTNATANCEEVVVRTASVSVTTSRPALSVDNPQFWAVGVTVTASVFEGTTSRSATLPPDERRTVTVPFNTVREGSWAPRESVEAVIQVSQGSAALADRTETVTFEPVKAGQDC